MFRLVFLSLYLCAAWNAFAFAADKDRPNVVLSLPTISVLTRSMHLAMQKLKRPILIDLFAVARHSPTPTTWVRGAEPFAWPVAPC